VQKRRIGNRRPVYNNNKDVQEGDNYRKEISSREIRAGQLRMNVNVNETESVNENE